MGVRRGQRKTAMRKTGGVCWYCGAEADTIDHFEPQRCRRKARQYRTMGKRCQANLLPACRRCNEFKSNKFLPELREFICFHFGLEDYKFYGETVLPVPQGVSQEGTCT